MQVTVYHNERNGKMVRVAVVQAPGECVDQCLEYAYRYTNNIEGSWSKGSTIEWQGETNVNNDFNENVEFVGEYPIGKDGTVYGARSTMMGDVMFCDGDKYEVHMVGFRKCN